MLLDFLLSAWALFLFLQDVVSYHKQAAVSGLCGVSLNEGFCVQTLFLSLCQALTVLYAGKGAAGACGTEGVPGANGSSFLPFDQEED